MVKESVIALIREHYSSSSQPLLLSEFGKILREQGLWPPQGPKRKLADYLRTLSPEVEVSQDDDTPAFKYVVLPEFNEAVRESLVIREELAFLTGLAVKEYKAAHLHFNRIDLRREADAIFLPPQNFELKGGKVMRDLFSEMRRGQRRWDDRFPEAEVQQYKAGDLPKLAAPSKFRRDARKIVFVEPHPTAYHGNKWNDDHDQAIQDDLLMLKSLYRFGGALPAGYQHDAQREKGKLFKRQPFNCSVNGEINVSDDHADIYPNDYIRHRTK